MWPSVPATSGELTIVEFRATVFRTTHIGQGPSGGIDTMREGPWELDVLARTSSPNIPPWTLEAGDWNDLTLSAALYHVSETDFLEDGAANIPAYTRLDLRAAQRFRLGKSWQGELYGVVQNAGQDYHDFERKNIYDTRAFVGVKLYQ